MLKLNSSDGEWIDMDRHDKFTLFSDVEVYDGHI